MSRFGSLGTQYFGDDGKPLSNGRIYFFETGTTTDKDTYADTAEVIPNSQPVLLTAQGRQPDIFFTGLANAVLQDATGAQVDQADPVGTTVADDAFAAWNPFVTYALTDIVTGSSGLYYLSIVAPNSNNDPTAIGGAASWMEVKFMSVYNISYGYQIGDIIISAGRLWLSRTGANISNTPNISPLNWEPLSIDMWPETNVQLLTFLAETGRSYLIDTTVGPFDMEMPESPLKGDRVKFTDYGAVFATQSLTIKRNTVSNENIMNLAEDLICDINLFSGVLEYTNGRGWILT
jgi:hypothetical protein